MKIGIGIVYDTWFDETIENNNININININIDIDIDININVVIVYERGLEDFLLSDEKGLQLSTRIRRMNAV